VGWFAIWFAILVALLTTFSLSLKPCGGAISAAIGGVRTCSRTRSLVFVIPGLLLGLYAQWRIKLNVAKYSQVATQDGITGAEVARRLLDSKGLRMWQSSLPQAF
jgi:putative neutral zinc metallopeptidase